MSTASRAAADERFALDCELFPTAMETQVSNGERLDADELDDGLCAMYPEGHLDVDGLADLLRRTAELEPVEVALGLAALGVPVVPTVPGDKDPMLTAKHIRGVDRHGEVIGEACRVCQLAQLVPAKDHGATTDAETIRRYWGAHPDAGVGMKNHPELVRGDGDFASSDELKKARKRIGYGQGDVAHHCPEPFEARTPGGMYRRRWLHVLPAGVPSPGGGTGIHGVSWYGSAGYVVVKGGHPNGGVYAPFAGAEITELPEPVRQRLRRRVVHGGDTVTAASSGETETFLAAHVGSSRYSALDRRRRRVATAAEGQRHAAARDALRFGFVEAVAGWYPARALHDAVRDALGEAGWDDTRFGGEWGDMVAWAAGPAQHISPDEALDECDTLAGLVTGGLDAHYDPEWIEHLERSAPRDLSVDEIDELLAVDDSGDDAPAHITFKRLPDPFTLPELDWLAHGILAHPTHGQLAGPEKSLKSYVGTAVDVALAAGVDVLGHWTTPRPVTVLALIGEGGETNLLRRVARIADGYGVPIGDVRSRFHYTTQTAPVSSPAVRDGLQQALDEIQPDLVHIDPWYAYSPLDADARNLYEVGAALERIGALVTAGGASLIINNHFNQTGNGNGLRRISMAGHAEWCDSWWLLDHREPPDVTAGRFRLRLDVGSRQWGGGAFDIDFTIGRFDIDNNDHDGRINWKVTNAVDTDESVGGDESKIADAKHNLVKAWTRRRDKPPHNPWTKTEWVERAPGVTATHTRAAFEELVDGGRIQTVDGHRDKGARYRLVLSESEQNDA